MTKQPASKKLIRKQDSPEFRKEALALAGKIGVAKGARELGLHDSQLYGWRKKPRPSVLIQLGQGDKNCGSTAVW